MPHSSIISKIHFSTKIRKQNQWATPISHTDKFFCNTHSNIVLISASSLSRCIFLKIYCKIFFLICAPSFPYNYFYSLKIMGVLWFANHSSVFNCTSNISFNIHFYLISRFRIFFLLVFLVAIFQKSTLFSNGFN